MGFEEWWTKGNSWGNPVKELCRSAWDAGLREARVRLVELGKELEKIEAEELEPESSAPRT